MEIRLNGGGRGGGYFDAPNLLPWNMSSVPLRLADVHAACSSARHDTSGYGYRDIALTPHPHPLCTPLPPSVYPPHLIPTPFVPPLPTPTPPEPKSKYPTNRLIRSRKGQGFRRQGRMNSGERVNELHDKTRQDKTGAARSDPSPSESIVFVLAVAERHTCICFMTYRHAKNLTMRVASLRV